MPEEIQQRGSVKDIRSYLETAAVQEQLAKVLPSHLTPERFARVALTAMTKTPRLLECTRESLLRCLMDCSAVGLEPNGREAHLIPHRNNKAGVVEATLIFDFKGLVTLARRTGKIDIFRAEVVCDKDEFEWRDGVVHHRINFREKRGNVFAAYSHVRFVSGADDFEVMQLDEIESIRRRSRSGDSGPWVSDWNEMAKKTVIRRHVKRLEISPELTDALEKDDDRLDERNVTPRHTARQKPHDPRKALDRPKDDPEDDAPVIGDQDDNYEMEPPKE